MRTAVGYIGADAFLNKKSGRGGRGGKGGGGRGGPAKGR
jgi:23S rRNA pseudouridine2605 synthase